MARRAKSHVASAPIRPHFRYQTKTVAPRQGSQRRDQRNQVIGHDMPARPHNFLEIVGQQQKGQREHQAQEPSRGDAIVAQVALHGGNLHE